MIQKLDEVDGLVCLQVKLDGVVGLVGFKVLMALYYVFYIRAFPFKNVCCINWIIDGNMYLKSTTRRMLALCSLRIII